MCQAFFINSIEVLKVHFLTWIKFIFLSIGGLFLLFFLALLFELFNDNLLKSIPHSLLFLSRHKPSLLVDDLDDFRVDWYVRELMGSGVVEAVENYGIGERITYWEDIQAGDFLQFWRNNGSGHNNIFIEWKKQDPSPAVPVLINE